MPYPVDLAPIVGPNASGSAITGDKPPNSGDDDAAKRVREAVESAGGPTDVSRRAGLPLSTLKSYMGGREARRGALVAIADACGVSVEWLATGRGERHGNWITERTPGADPLGEQEDGTVVARGPTLPIELPPSYVAIPRYNVSASAGSGSLVENTQVVEYFAFSEQYLRLKLHRQPHELGLIEARGDSMEPTIRDGDVLTVDVRPDQNLENGRLYVLQVDDALLVKRLEIRLQTLVLHSDNPRYSPETITRAEADNLHIVGQVLLVSAPPR